MSDKFYKCPYCDAKFSRSAIGNHIELNHEELVPKGMTANQVGFNTVNRKIETHGCCVVCKRPTRWNEKNCKYDRLCGRPECREALREKYKKNMLKVHGKYNLLNDPDRQERMLANRRISDTYRFTDGGRHVYTGTYERKALEFLDKVMGFHSREILSPGPVLEYEYKGQKLKWITDIVLIPFNLIIEVKDGGSNPNNREMPTYREKQVAKEIMITNLGKYNYLRLTNNNFEQLLDIIAELKMQMIDDTAENRKVLIRVNEEVDMINESTTNIILSPKEFKEARDFIKKVCKGTDGFKWKFHESKFNKAGRVARIDYTIPGDIGGGMESNWCDLDEFLREYIFPELRRDKNRKFIFRSVNDNEDCIDIYAMLKSNPTYPEVPIGKGEIENANNPNEKSFKYPKTDANIEYVDKDIRKSVKESQQYLDSFHEAVASKYTKNYKNLDQFCKAITSPSEVNDWYFVNKVRWFTDKEGLKRNAKRNNPDHKDIIVWPDELLQTKLGICYDHAIFMHYCCERFGIKNAILIIAATVEFPFKKELTMLGHAVTIYELPGIGWYIFNYQKNLGSVLGPYSSVEDAVKAYKNWYTVYLLRIPTNFGHKKFSLTPKIHNVYTQIHDSKEQFAAYDQFYNDKYCTQDDLFRRIPGAYDFFDKIPDERMYWFEDFIEKFNLIKKVKSFFESAEFITEEVMKDKDEKILAKKNRESKMISKSVKESQQYLDSFHEAVASKYTKNYKNLDQFCKAITSPIEVNDWYFVNKVRWVTEKEGAKRYKERHGEGNSKCFIVWPDELLQTKVGICYDHAIFMHYCCERFGIKNAILAIVAMVQFPFKKELMFLGHAVTIYELPGIGWYLFNYQTNLGSVLGPYESLEETVKEYKNWYTKFLLSIPTNFGHKSFNLKPSIHSVHVQVQDKKEQFAVYDQMYNDKYCSQDDLIRRVPGMFEFMRKIPRERTYWVEEFIEKFDLIKKVKSLFESAELITEEVIMKDKDEKILAKIRKNREFKKFTSKMSDEDKKKVESKMLTKSKGFLSKYASTFKKNHVTEKIILSTIVGLSLASIGVAIAPVTMAGVSFASDNIVDTIKKEETVIKESFGTVMMNLVYNGTNHYPEWFKPTTQFANMIIRETTKFLSKENGNFVHLSFYDPRDPSKEALDAAYYLGQYVQHLDTEENYWDSKKEQLTTTTGLFNVWIDKSDLNFTYMIIFDDDEIKKVLYVCYDTIGDRVALVPIEVPPLKTYRDEINMASRKVSATNNKTHSDQMDFILSLKGENIKLPSNSI